MLLEALRQAWPPFVLVASLLVIGAVAHRDGLFDRLGAGLENLPGPPAVLFAAACGLLAVVTALLNLDTAVVFVMPVVVLAARRRGVEATAFVYASLFMVNASSLYLPGSNLTNLLVLAGQPPAGSFAGRMLAPALAATLVTAVGLGVVFRSGLIAAGEPTAPGGAGRLGGAGALGALAAAVLMVLFANPALPVAAVAGIVAALAIRRGELTARDALEAISPQVLVLLLGVAVALGVLARVWHGPQQLLAHAGSAETAALAATSTVLVNNLPAAVLLSAHAVPHPRALIIGLNLGPNLAVTGSLAAFLWIRTAAQLDVATSVARLSRIGIMLAPLAIAAALLAAGA
ncbi:MAG TPA: SLC13 family permease [Solirubrobacteraceae bacterium]|nr:SLC13 family permease [Solirubrobacteraceae bacterium]